MGTVKEGQSKLSRIKNLVIPPLKEHFIRSALAHISLIYLSLSVILSLLGFRMRSILKLLSLKLSQPWGIITSPLIHLNTQHLLNNYIAIITCHFFILVLILYNIVANTLTNKVFMNYRTLGDLYGITILFSGTIAPGTATYIALYILENTKLQVLGASGISYALLGYMIPLTIITTLNTTRVYMQNTALGKKLIAFLIPINAYVAFILIWYTLNPLEFLSHQPEVNTLAHLIGFTLGALIPLFLIMYKVIKESLLKIPRKQV